MKCPRCSVSLEVVTMSDIEIDICSSSCGGIWFDHREFKKLDEVHEGDSDFLSKLSQATKNTPIDGKVNCPKCDDVTLMTRFHSSNKQTEIDECGVCGGIWLDDNELLNIYRTCPTEEDRKKAFNVLFNKDFSIQLDTLKKQSEDDLKKARRIANMFKYICPSYYIKGDQDGGAF